MTPQVKRGQLVLAEVGERHRIRRHNHGRGIKEARLAHAGAQGNRVLIGPRGVPVSQRFLTLILVPKTSIMGAIRWFCGQFSASGHMHSVVEGTLYL